MVDVVSGEVGCSSRRRRRKLWKRSEDIVGSDNDDLEIAQAFQKSPNVNLSIWSIVMIVMVVDVVVLDLQVSPMRKQLQFYTFNHSLCNS